VHTHLHSFFLLFSFSAHYVIMDRENYPNVPEVIDFLPDNKSESCKTICTFGSPLQDSLDVVGFRRALGETVSRKRTHSQLEDKPSSYRRAVDVVQTTPRRASDEVSANVSFASLGNEEDDRLCDLIDDLTTEIASEGDHFDAIVRGSSRRNEPNETKELPQLLERLRRLEKTNQEQKNALNRLKISYNDLAKKSVSQTASYEGMVAAYRRRIAATEEELETTKSVHLEHCLALESDNDTLKIANSTLRKTHEAELTSLRLQRDVDFAKVQARATKERLELSWNILKWHSCLKQSFPYILRAHQSTTEKPGGKNFSRLPSSTLKRVAASSQRKSILVESNRSILGKRQVRKVVKPPVPKFRTISQPKAKDERQSLEETPRGTRNRDSGVVPPRRSSGLPKPSARVVTTGRKSKNRITAVSKPTKVLPKGTKKEYSTARRTTKQREQTFSLKLNHGGAPATEPKSRVAESNLSPGTGLGKRFDSLYQSWSTAKKAPRLQANVSDIPCKALSFAPADQNTPIPDTQINCNSIHTPLLVKDKLDSVLSPEELLFSPLSQASTNNTKESACIQVQRTWRAIYARERFLSQKKASITIQCHFRRYLSQQAYLKKRYAALRLQAYLRCSLKSKHAQRRQRAAHVIQHSWREYQRSVNATRTIMKAWKSYQAKSRASQLIQTCSRRNLSKLKHERRNESSKVIQLCWKKYRKQGALKKRATILVQKWWRGLQLKAVRNYKMTKALLLQSQWRCYRARSALLRCVASTVLLQRNWRRFAAFKSYQDHKLAIWTIQIKLRDLFQKNKRKHSCALSIQTLWRRYLERKRYSSVRKGFVTLQSLCRMRQRHMEFKSFRSSVVFMQRKVSFCYSKRQRSVILLQAQQRGFVCRTVFVRQRQAAIKIQRCITYQHHQKAQAEVKRRHRAGLVIKKTLCQCSKRQRQAKVIACTTIQTSYRTYCQLSKYKTARLSVHKIQRAFRTERKKRQSMSTRIQRVWRSACLRQQKRRAAVVIQSFVRGANYRQSCSQQECAVVKIQKRMRGAISRLSAYKIKQSILILQRHARVYLRYRLKRIVSIQSAWRGRQIRLKTKKRLQAACALVRFVKRTHWKKVRATKLIAAAYRMYRCRSIFRMRRSKAILLQSLVRRNAQPSFATLRAAVIRIQRNYRAMQMRCSMAKLVKEQCDIASTGQAQIEQIISPIPPVAPSPLDPTPKITRKPLCAITPKNMFSPRKTRRGTRLSRPRLGASPHHSPPSKKRRTTRNIENSVNNINLANVHQGIQQMYESMKVVELRSLLLQKGVEAKTIRNLRKADLVTHLVDMEAST